MRVEGSLQFSVHAPPKNVPQAVARRRPCTILVIFIKHVLKIDLFWFYFRLYLNLTVITSWFYLKMVLSSVEYIYTTLITTRLVFFTRRYWKRFDLNGQHIWYLSNEFHLLCSSSKYLESGLAWWRAKWLNFCTSKLSTSLFCAARNSLFDNSKEKDYNQ